MMAQQRLKFEFGIYQFQARTDPELVGIVSIAVRDAIIKMMANVMCASSLLWNETKGAQEAHEAIRLTHKAKPQSTKGQSEKPADG